MRRPCYPQRVGGSPWLLQQPRFGSLSTNTSTLFTSRTWTSSTAPSRRDIWARSTTGGCSAPCCKLLSVASSNTAISLQETRLQVSPTRFRVPDTCLMRQDDLPERIITKAPLLCIEVMSPEDRLPRLINRCHEYLAIGVPVVWIIDPGRRSAHILATDSSVAELRTGTLELARPPIQLSLSQVFSGLKQL